MNPFLPITDLVMTVDNDSIITIIIGNNELAIIGKNDVITNAIMGNNPTITYIIMSNNEAITAIITCYNVVIIV